MLTMSASFSSEIDMSLFFFEHTNWALFAHLDRSTRGFGFDRDSHGWSIRLGHFVVEAGN
jgi:hypothetical protein